MNPVILIGLTPQGLSMLRVLSRAGANVVAFCSSKRNVGYSSKYGKKYLFKNTDDLKLQIREFIHQYHEKLLCYITSGEALAMILQEYPELYLECNVISGPYEVVERFAHKDLMYQHAIGCGFNVVPYVTLDKLDESKWKYPFFVKRNYEIPLPFKTSIINSDYDLSNLRTSVPVDNWPYIMIQELIPVAKTNRMEFSVQCYFSHGVLNGSLVGHQKRKTNTGLTSRLVEITDPEIVRDAVELCKKFMKDTSYTGFAEFEFLRDTVTCTNYFLEVNTRPCGTHSSLVSKFSNLVEVLLNPYGGAKLKITDNHVNWRNIARDIRVVLGCGISGQPDFSVFCSFDVFDIRDMKPFITQFIPFL